MARAEELKALRKKLASLRLSNGVGSSENDRDSKPSINKDVIGKMKGFLKSKKSFIKLWDIQGGYGENHQSIDSANSEEAKSTPSSNWRQSASLK